jgi:hypothetical protein
LREQQAQLDTIAAQLAEKEAALAALTQELSQTQDTAGVTPTDANQAEPTQSAALETVTVPAIRVRPTSSTPQVSVQDEAATALSTTPSAGIALTPRSADLVREALADAPGLGRAAQAQKDQLQAALVRGECVTDALKDTFGRVNPHTLVALLENMEMCGS